MALDLSDELDMDLAEAEWSLEALAPVDNAARGGGSLRLQEMSGSGRLAVQPPPSRRHRQQQGPRQRGLMRAWAARDPEDASSARASSGSLSATTTS